MKHVRAREWHQKNNSLILLGNKIRTVTGKKLVTQNFNCKDFGKSKTNLFHLRSLYFLEFSLLNKLSDRKTKSHELLLNKLSDRKTNAQVRVIAMSSSAVFLIHFLVFFLLTNL